MKEGEPGYCVSTRKGRVPSAEEKASAGPAPCLWLLEHYGMDVTLPPPHRKAGQREQCHLGASKLANGMDGSRSLSCKKKISVHHTTFPKQAPWKSDWTSKSPRGRAVRGQTQTQDEGEAQDELRKRSLSICQPLSMGT